MNYILKIKELLEQKRIPLGRFAQLIGKNRNTVTNYLSGKTKIDVDTLIKIASVLGVPVSYFFGEGGSVVQANGGIAGINHGHIDIRISEQQREIERLRSELEACREVVRAKEEVIRLLKEKIDLTGRTS